MPLQSRTQIKMVSEQGNWTKLSIFGSLLAMDEMQPWELDKTHLSLGKMGQKKQLSKKTTGVRLQPGRVTASCTR